MTAARRPPPRKRTRRLSRRGRDRTRNPHPSPSRRETSGTGGRGQPRRTFFELPPLELECMKALWTLEADRPADSGTSVREIRARVSVDHRPLAYTTVETIMDRLARKGAVTRRKQGKAHRYSVVYQKSAARAQGVAALVKHFFSGSRRALYAYLSGQPVPEAAPLRRPAPPPQQAERALARGNATPSARSGRGAKPIPVRGHPQPSPSRGSAAPEAPLDASLL